MEYVVVLPLILLLLMGTAELSNALMQYNNLTKAIRGAAMYASDHTTGTTASTSTSGDALEKEITNIILYGNIAGSGIATMPGAAPSVSVTKTGTDIAISATWVYEPIFSILPGFNYGSDVDSGITLTASTVVRKL